jgi:hypothetical protein
LLGALPAFAGTITYDCDTSSLGSASTPGTECNTLTTTVAGQYMSFFTNANATIYVTQANLSGDVAENTQIFNTVNYSNYYTALKNNESGADDVAAVNSLGACAGFGCANPVTGSSSVNLTGPLESALGLGTPQGICFLTSGGCNNNENDSTYGSCALGSSNCYNDIIEVDNSAVLSPNSSQYDFVTAVEHETDEALGTSSCLNTNPKTGAAQNSCGASVSAADLFRYSASGTRSFYGANGNQAKGSLAYFSINGGLTNLADYNNTNNGADYGDFSTSCTYVQDADGCPGRQGVTIGNDGGVELALLDAVGYNLTTAGMAAETFGTPEPSGMAMFLGGAAAIVWMRRRRVPARG